MNAAGIVADHPAQRAVIVGRGVGSEPESVGRQLLLQLVENAPGLDACPARAGIDLEHTIHPAAQIEHHRDVAALTGEAGAASAREHRRAVRACDPDRRHHVFDVPRQHHADRRLPVVRGVGGVEGAGAVVESHLAAEARHEIALERARRLERESARRQSGSRKTRHEGSAPEAAPARRAHSRNRSASWVRISRPQPGRDGSGSSVPLTGSGAPSNSICSIRA